MAGQNLFGHVALLNALDLRLRGAEIVCTGPEAERFAQAALKLPFVGRIVLRAEKAADLPPSHPAQDKLKAVTGSAAFVCVGERCSLPVTERGAIADAVARDAIAQRCRDTPLVPPGSTPARCISRPECTMPVRSAMRGWQRAGHRTQDESRRSCAPAQGRFGDDACVAASGTTIAHGAIAAIDNRWRDIAPPARSVLTHDAARYRAAPASLLPKSQADAAFVTTMVDRDHGLHRYASGEFDVSSGAVATDTPAMRRPRRRRPLIEQFLAANTSSVLEIQPRSLRSRARQTVSALATMLIARYSAGRLRAEGRRVIPATWQQRTTRTRRHRCRAASAQTAASNSSPAMSCRRLSHVERNSQRRRSQVRGAGASTRIR